MNSRFSLGVGGGYFFIWIPREIAAITSISNAKVSSTLMGVPSFRSWPPPLLAFVIAYCYSIVKPQFYFFQNIFFATPKAYPFSRFNLIIISGLFQLFSFARHKHTTPASITHFTPLPLTASHYYNAALSFRLSCIYYRYSILTNARLLNIIEIR